MEATAKERSRFASAPLVAVGLGAALLLVVAGAAVFAISRDDGGRAPRASASAQLASVRHACQQWADEDAGRVGDRDFCGRMGTWMRDHMDRSGTGPQMMWGTPEQMRNTCRRWMGTTGSSGTASGQGWCDTMVDWMDHHVRDWGGQDSWDGWMMNGPMMGR